MVAPFQLRLEKKDTVVCPLLRHSNYNQKKKIQSFGHHSLRRSNCHCCAVPITTRKKRYSHLSIVTPFQLRPEKKDTVVWPSFVALFQLPWLRRSNYDQKKNRYSRLSIVMPFQLRPEKKIKSSGHHSLRRSNCHCCADPITTRTTKRYSRQSVVTPFQIRPEKKTRKKIFMRRRTSLSILVAPFP
jgi:hypothetical protein